MSAGVDRALSDAAFRSRAAGINEKRMAEQEDARVNMAKIEEVYAAAKESFGKKKTP